jgi:hypothetical protein
MSVSNDSTSTGTIDDGRASLSSAFLEFCAKVRNNDPSILPAVGEPFTIRRMHEREGMELADALLENNSVTYLELETENHTKSSTEAIAKYILTSKRLQRIRLDRRWAAEHREFWQREDKLCCFLSALQERTSLKKLHMALPLIRGSSNLALEHMLTHTQSLRSLRLFCQVDQLDDIALAGALSGLKKNTTLRELTLHTRGATTLSPVLTSLRDHPLLQRVSLRGHAVDLNGLAAVLLSKNSQITELDIHRIYRGLPITDVTNLLQALGRRPTLTKLRLRGIPLDRDNARQLVMVLRNTPSLQTLG